MRAQSKTSPLFLIGKNSRGTWVAQKQHGCCGGLFVSRAAALKFALFENGNRPEAVITVPGVFELDMGGCTFKVHHSTLDAAVSHPAQGVGFSSHTSVQPTIAQAA